MQWQKINSVRIVSNDGYVIEALGQTGARVYVVWPPVATGDRLFKWPHRVVASFSKGTDAEKVKQAKQFCVEHNQQGEKDAA